MFAKRHCDSQRLQRAARIASIVLSVGVMISGIGCDPSADPTYTAESQDVFALTNAERVANDLPALAWNSTLASAARKHAQDMADRDYFAHESPEGLSSGDRATAEGYAWQMVGENLAMGQRAAADVVQAWMNSEGHRANILQDGFTDMGVGVAANADGTLYWVQMFGTAIQ
jgi:uncharacterized protein YkwD